MLKNHAPFIFISVRLFFYANIIRSTKELPKIISSILIDKDDQIYPKKLYYKAKESGVIKKCTK